MSRYCYLIDAGHGGMIDGIYQTRGKRSPKYNGETLIYEGVNNRINAELLIDELEDRDIDVIYLTPTAEDTGLWQRVQQANELSRTRKCIYISIHSNAAGSKGQWTNARGNGVYIGVHHSLTTDHFSRLLAREIQDNYKNITKWRGIKERNFYVLRKTICPAVLLEIGFHDNLEEAQLMLTDDWRNRFVKSVVDAIEILESTTL